MVRTHGLYVLAREGGTVTFILVVGFGIAAILWLIGLMDWYARRKDGEARQRAA